jgi:hypothetical protein
MNPRTPKYIKDIYEYIESINFGEADVHIKRIDHRTVQLSTLSEETLRYVDNAEAVKDLINMVQRLVEASFSGEAHIKLEMKDGNIQLIGIFDKKNIKY